MATNVKNLPLGRELFREYLLNEKLFPPGYVGSREEFLSRIEEEHERLGGLHSKVKYPLGSLRKALAQLRDLGYYENPTTNSWRRIAVTTEHATQNQILVNYRKAPPLAVDPSKPITVGKGGEAIYAWYLPQYLKDVGHFPMKIGKTSSSVEVRITEQVGYLPEKPVIGFVLCTDHSNEWERLLHTVLKLMHRSCPSAVGTEWYETTPEELAEIVHQLQALISNDHEPEPAE
ncbi:MAG: GIY-YIG nuclease family protein [Gammaproteobacteria bacterium]|nr:GIY-YIG nuclease family protein [Gammaproteobacteria bacterium]